MKINKQWFQRYKRQTELIFLLIYFTINGLINASTVLMEEMRNDELAFRAWEPFVWELSSAYSTLLLIPLIALFTKHYGWQWSAPLKSLVKYVAAAFVFSLMHVSVMVLVRETAYTLSDLEYDFATSTNHLIFELLYEIRKDIWSFLFFVIAIEVYRYSLCQWLGDTTSIFESPAADSNHQTTLPEMLLVKKLGKEFLIQTREIQWAESAGNYINLHARDSMYPMRITMTEFVEQAKVYGFVRIHRSQVINLHFIDHIERQPSGDAKIQMKDGYTLTLSRRFKEQFEDSVQGLSLS